MSNKIPGMCDTDLTSVTSDNTNFNNDISLKLQISCRPTRYIAYFSLGTNRVNKEDKGLK